MEQSVLTKITAILCVVAIVCSAVSLYYSLQPKDDNSMSEKYTVYFGLSDRTLEEATEMQTSIGVLVGRECHTGYTTYLAEGASMIDGSLVKDGYTAIFIITMVSSEEIYNLVNASNEEFGIKAVLVERQYADADLVLF